jgi:hypothetical protein
VPFRFETSNLRRLNDAAPDIAQIDTNNDGTIDKNEFAASCAKGLVRVPVRKPAETGKP